MKSITIQVSLDVEVPDTLTSAEIAGLGINVDHSAITVMQDYHGPLNGARVIGHTTTAVYDENGEEVEA